MRHRDRRDHDDAAGDPTALVRDAIARITAQRDAARVAAGRALVNQVQVQAALRRQRHELGQAREQLDSAITLAARVAAETQEQDGALAAAPFVGNVQGLRVQADVVDLAIGQIDGLRDVSGGQVQQARDLLGRSVSTLDAALREQLQLLLALERLDRQRALLRARKSR